MDFRKSMHGWGKPTPYMIGRTECIAVTDEEMDEIWKLVRVGTPIEIKP